jgi:hypothetical protein
VAGGGGAQRLFVPSRDDDLGALLRQLQRDGGPDAHAPARDEGDLTSE